MSKWFMWACCGVMVLGGILLLWTKGYANILSYGMLLLCPLMHLFMMRGHGHDHGGHDDASHGDSNTSGTSQKPACH